MFNRKTNISKVILVNFAAYINSRMRSSITRLIIFITTILISVIIGFQLHWLNKTYSFEKMNLILPSLKVFGVCMKTLGFPVRRDHSM